MEHGPAFDMWRDYLGLAGVLAELLRERRDAGEGEAASASASVSASASSSTPELVAAAPGKGEVASASSSSTPVPALAAAPGKGEAAAALTAASALASVSTSSSMPELLAAAPGKGEAAVAASAPASAWALASASTSSSTPEPASSASPGEPVCAFCKHNGEAKHVYTGHSLRDAEGRLRCPVLRSYVCPQCGATQDRAHTRRFCPLTRRGYTSVYSRSPRNSAGKRAAGGCGAPGAAAK